MPITREGMLILCKSMNLICTPTRAIDAVIYCRGEKMENGPESEFSMKKLVQWFLLNMKTMQHQDTKLVDTNWLIK